jgi:hypothetical protein
MQAVKRIFEDCRVCENRGLICVGDDDQDFPCPRCNGWCSLCLEQPLEGRHGRLMPGSLFAAVQRTPAGLELFEGYLCDWHKRFDAYIGIAPEMIGRFKPGDAFIAVQTIFGTNAFVELYGYREAKNWRDLEADALRAVAAQRWSPYGLYGEYPCPPDLAARAAPPDWVTWQIGDMRDRRILPSGARLTTWAVDRPADVLA